VAAASNGGKLVTPHVVKEITETQEDGTEKVVKSFTPAIKRQVISAETSSLVCDLLEDVVTVGSGKNAYVKGYRVAGKTGTSEKRDTVENKDDVVASFCGFAPADDPKVAVLVFLDDPQTEIRYGGTLSAPVAQKIFESILPHLNIEPSYTADELASLSRTVPSVVGQSTAAAQTKVINVGLEVKIVGDGKEVVRQVPEAGQTIPAGGTVLLYTEDDDMEMVTVPNFVGRSVTEVNSIATQAGLNVQMQGLVGGSSAAARANSQSVTAGTKVPRGTVIKVNFVYTDTSDG
jgi:stage V sporulation protein D (sporulation-specific penicillin-binding protein)